MREVLAFFCFFVAACAEETRSTDRIDVEPPRYVSPSAARAEHPPPPSSWDSIMATYPPLDVCEVVRHVTLSLDSIRRWPLRITRLGDAGCRESIVDSLVVGFSRTGRHDYLEALDSLRTWSDTDFAERLALTPREAYDLRPRELLRYIARDRTATSAFARDLIETWFGEYRGRADSAEAKAQLRAAIESALPASSRTPDESEFIANLLVRSGLTE